MVKYLLPTAAVAALQSGDGVLIGHAGAGLYGDHEESVLITFTAGPDRSDNDVEVLIPRRVWAGFQAAIAQGQGGTFVVGSCLP